MAKVLIYHPDVDAAWPLDNSLSERGHVVDRKATQGESLTAIKTPFSHYDVVLIYIDSESYQAGDEDVVEFIHDVQTECEQIRIGVLSPNQDGLRLSNQQRDLLRGIGVRFMLTDTSDDRNLKWLDAQVRPGRLTEQELLIPHFSMPDTGLLETGSPAHEFE